MHSTGNGGAGNIFYSNPYQAEAAAQAYQEMGLIGKDADSDSDSEAEPASSWQTAYDSDSDAAPAAPVLAVSQKQKPVKEDESDPFQTNFFLKKHSKAEFEVAKKDAQQAGVGVTVKNCKDFSAEIGAMGCSLVTQISGFPEGCECQLRASSCPAYASTKSGASVFTGTSQSDTLFGVTLCMYWQWLDAPDKSAENKEVYDTELENTKELIKTAEDNAANLAAAIATPLWGAMPTPFPVLGTYV